MKNLEKSIAIKLRNDRIAQLYVSGNSCLSIAKMIGLSNGYVCKIISDLGIRKRSRSESCKMAIKYRRPHHTVTREPEVWSHLRKHGATYDEIARSFDCSYATVYKTIND